MGMPEKQNVDSREKAEKITDSALLGRTRHVMNLASSIDPIDDPRYKGSRGWSNETLEAKDREVGKEDDRNRKLLAVYIKDNFPTDVSLLLAKKARDEVERLRGLEEALKQKIDDPRSGKKKALYERALEEVRSTDIIWELSVGYGSDGVQMMRDEIIEAAQKAGIQGKAAESLAGDIMKYKMSAESYIKAKLKLADAEGDERASAMVRKGMRAVRRMDRGEE